MEENDNHKLRIEVVYADSTQVHVLPLAVCEGSTVKEAIDLSGILAICPDINFDVNKVGIFSIVCELDTVVDNGDRVEIYRPLINDPKDARRKRAIAEKS